jgi:hypothetical protein
MIEKEHDEINKLILSLFTQFENLPLIIEHQDTMYSEHGDYTCWINHQILCLKNSYLILSTNSYKSVFSLIRTSFEAFWIIDLAMNGTKFYLNYVPKKDQNIQKIYQEWIKDYNATKSEKIKQGILEIKSPSSNKIKVIYLGRKNTDGSIIPNYYFLFKEYNPEVAHLGFEEPYYENIQLDKIRDELINKHKGLRDYFSFGDGVRHNLLLNDLITKEQFERARVHYNFLSMWTHPSINSIHLIQKNIQGNENFEQIKKYDFILTRLALLYIGKIMCMYLNSFIKFTDRQLSEGKIKSLKNKSNLLKSVNEFDTNTDYFWFIFNEPHYYYKWKFMIKKIGKENEDVIKKISINDLKASEIEYYKNPVETLKDLSTSWENKLIGKYDSPIEKERLERK